MADKKVTKCVKKVEKKFKINVTTPFRYKKKNLSGVVRVDEDCKNYILKHRMGTLV